jgi:hypothetical protein
MIPHHDEADANTPGARERVSKYLKMEFCLLMEDLANRMPRRWEDVAAEQRRRLRSLIGDALDADPPPTYLSLPHFEGMTFSVKGNELSHPVDVGLLRSVAQMLPS